MWLPVKFLRIHGEGALALCASPHEFKSNFILSER